MLACFLPSDIIVTKSSSKFHGNYKTIICFSMTCKMPHKIDFQQRIVFPNLTLLFSMTHLLRYFPEITASHAMMKCVSKPFTFIFPWLTMVLSGDHRWSCREKWKKMATVCLGRNIVPLFKDWYNCYTAVPSARLILSIYEKK